MTLRRVLGWVAVIALLELVVRAAVYGMANDVTGAGQRLGGPGFVAVLLVALSLGALVSVGMVWLAGMGIRERWALAERRPEGDAPRIALRPMLRRAAALTLAGWLVFAAVETWIHWRAGMGFHGLECLVGPGHRNALPVVGGLALVVSALLSVAALVLTWMRRTVAAFAVPRARHAIPRAARLIAFSTRSRRTPSLTAAAPRGPPCVVA